MASAIARYRETESKEHLDAITTDYFLPLCQRAYQQRQYHRFAFEEAVDFAMDACLERVKPAYQRRLIERTGQPIAGYDPSKISERTGKPVCPFAFFSSVARNATSDLNRLRTKEGKAHSEFLEGAYTLLRHAPAMGDNIGLLNKLVGDDYSDVERMLESTPEADYYQRVQAYRALVRALLKARTAKVAQASPFRRIQVHRVDSKGRKIL